MQTLHLTEITELPEHNIQLGKRCSPHTVYKSEYSDIPLKGPVGQLHFTPLLPIPYPEGTGIGRIFDDTAGEELGNFVRTQQEFPLPARLTVYADTHLHLVLIELEGG